MDYYKIGGIAIAAIIATLGAVKLELIKGVVSKMTSDKGNINFISIVSLIIVSVVPAIFGFYYSDNTPTNLNAEIQEQQIPDKKTDLEIGLEVGKEVIATTKQLVDEHNANKKIKDSIFKANRSQRWVYKIGDLMDNDEAIFELYKKLKEIENICLFSYKDKFFLFKNTENSKKQLDDSLDSFISKVGYKATVFDLMTYCTNTNGKENIIRTKDYKLGKRKDKTKIECYTVDK